MIRNESHARRKRFPPKRQKCDILAGSQNHRNFLHFFSPLPTRGRQVDFFLFFFFLVFHKRSYFSLTFFSDKTTTKFLSNFEENWGQAEEMYGMAEKVFILSVSPGQNLSFWQCLGEEKILSHTFGRQEVFGRCWGGSEVGQHLEARGAPQTSHSSVLPLSPPAFRPGLGAQRSGPPPRRVGARCPVLTGARFPAPALPRGNRAPALGP